LGPLFNGSIEEAKKRLHAILYDGAAVNQCFNPDPNVAGLSRAERVERRAVCAEYATVEESTCIEHRLTCVLEHVIDDPTNPSSVAWKALLDDLYAAADFVAGSQKNEQELRRVQLIDPNRIGEVVLDIHTPKTRWSYNAAQTLRNLRLIGYYAKMDIGNMSCETQQQISDWKRKLQTAQIAAEMISLLLPIISRFALWITLFQTSQYPSISLVLYMIDDLLAVANSIGDYVDNIGDEVLEGIASRFVAEIEAEFANDINSDYLKLAQLLDPRVAFRTTSRAEAERLIKLVNKFILYPERDVYEAGDNGEPGADDIFGNVGPAAAPTELDPQFVRDCSYFLNNCMSQARKKVRNPTGDGSIFEYWGGCERSVDIDVFLFYQPHYKNMEILERGIRSVLGERGGSDSPERVFSKGGIVVSPRRCSLLPSRADQLITSAVRYSSKSKKVKRTPRIPSLGEIVENLSGVATEAVSAARAALIADIDDYADYLFANTGEVINLDADELAGEEARVRDVVNGEEEKIEE
jgi:hypothetical protein